MKSKRNQLPRASNGVRINQDIERESSRSSGMAKAKNSQRGTEVLRASKLL